MRASAAVAVLVASVLTGCSGHHHEESPSTTSADGVAQLLHPPKAHGPCAGLRVTLQVGNHKINLAGTLGTPTIASHVGDLVTLAPAGPCAETVSFSGYPGMRQIGKYQLVVARSGHPSVWATMPMCARMNCLGGLKILGTVQLDVPG